jgi:hypothetical protein
MNNKWKHVLGIILAAILLLFGLSIWTLFLPNWGDGLISFGVMFPASLITITLAVLFVTIQEG